MKSRLLIIIGIIVIVSSIGAIQFSSVSYDVEYCQDWCDVEELSKLGCNSQVIDFINRATNLFDENFDNSIFYLNWIGLPDSISQEKFDKCLDIILEKRVESLENTDLDSKGCPQFCSEKVADNVFSFCGEDGFYSENYIFTNNSTHYFDQNYCEWKLIGFEFIDFDNDTDSRYLGGPGTLDDLNIENSPIKVHSGLGDLNALSRAENDPQKMLEICMGRFEIPVMKKTLWSNETHKIISNICKLEKRSDSAVTLDRTVYTTPFGYYPRDTTGNYDHCFSYKTDPEYGVKIQNTTHILNPENCEWEVIYQIDDMQEIIIDENKVDTEPEPPTISDEQEQMMREYCETGIRHPDMIGIPQCIKNEPGCGPGPMFVDGICHLIITDFLTSEDHNGMGGFILIGIPAIIAIIIISVIGYKKS